MLQIEVCTNPGSGSPMPGSWTSSEARLSLAARPSPSLPSHQLSSSSQPGSLVKTRSRAASLIAAVPRAEVSPAHHTFCQRLFSRAWLQLDGGRSE